MHAHKLLAFWTLANEGVLMQAQEAIDQQLVPTTHFQAFDDGGEMAWVQPIKQH
jgi:hypothetical protein